MNVVQRKVWVTIFTCKKCDKSENMWHYGEKKKPTYNSYPPVLEKESPGFGELKDYIREMGGFRMRGRSEVWK